MNDERTVENDAPHPVCAVGTSDHYCHLQGIRYNAARCVGGCDLTSVIPPGSSER